MRGLYIHIPFCNGLCPYCSFYSEKSADESIKEKYVDALITEISTLDKLIVNRITNLDTLLREFFRILSNDVLYYPFTYENKASGISASNYLKNKEAYFECLKGLNSELSADESKLKSISLVLFRNDEV